MFISNQKIKIKTKKTYIKMIILNKMKILFRNRKNKIFINSKIFISIKYNQWNKVNKFIKLNNHLSNYRSYKLKFMSQKLATSLFKNLSNNKIRIRTIFWKDIAKKNQRMFRKT